MAKEEPVGGGVGVGVGEDEGEGEGLGFAASAVRSNAANTRVVANTGLVIGFIARRIAAISIARRTEKVTS